MIGKYLRGSNNFPRSSSSPLSRTMAMAVNPGRLRLTARILGRGGQTRERGRPKTASAYESRQFGGSESRVARIAPGSPGGIVLGDLGNQPCQYSAIRFHQLWRHRGTENDHQSHFISFLVHSSAILIQVTPAVACMGLQMATNRRRPAACTMYVSM